MASNYIYLSGKGAWMHRLFEPEEYLGKTSWSMKIYPDPKSMKVFNETKLFLQRKKEDDEGVGVTFKRGVKKPWKLKKGEGEDFEPPVVLDKEGRPWPAEKLLGNGSEVTIKLEVYQTAKGKSARLDSVRVDKWVEYVPPDEGNSGEDPDDEISPF